MADQIRYDIKLNNQQALQSLNDLWTEARNGSQQAKYELNSKLGGEIKTTLVWSTEVDEKGFKVLKAGTQEVLTAYDKLDSAQSRFNRNNQSSVTSLRQQVNNAKQLRDGIARVATTTDATAGTVAGKLNPAWELANQKVNALKLNLAQAEGGILNIAKAKFPVIGQVLSIGNALTQVSFAAKAVVEIFQAVNAAIQPLIQRAKQIEGLSLSLSAFVGAQSNVNGVLSSAKAIALEYGGSLSQIERGYKRIAPAILASGGTLEDVEAVVEGLTAKTTQLGLNTEQTGRYIEAFAQVMGKGKLQAEELNQQFSELDGALRSQVALYLETRYGITDLNSAMRNGEVTAQKFREAFVFAAQSARDQLAGAIGQVQARIDDLNVQQIENIRNTLSTISLEGLNKTFEGFGMAMQRIATVTTQFFTAVSTNLPGLSEGFGAVFTLIGDFLSATWTGFLNGLFIAIKLVDTLIYGFVKLFEVLRNLPIIKDVIGGLQELGAAISDNFNQGTDAILGIGEGIDIAKGKFETLDADVDTLKQKFADGKISAQEYGAGLRDAYQTASNAQKAYLDAFNQEKDALNELKKEIEAKFKEENELIKEQIATKKDALQAEKDDLKTVTDALKDAYEERKQAIDDEIEKVKERYALELENAQSLTFAQKEEVRLRREKLQAIVNSSEASYEEKVQAQATLDRMDQQVKVAEIKKRQAAELKELEAKKAAEEERYNRQKKQAEEESLKRQESITKAIEQLAQTLKTNEQKQKEYNKQIEESTRLTDQQIDSLDDIPGLLDAQITRVNTARDAYWGAAKAASALADEVERANRAKANAPSTRNSGARASGGPVLGGSTYTVNELGQEGFLSASGKISKINAPAWGDWKAPGAGTVIPADIFATITATGGPGGASRASSSVAGARSGNGDLLRALMSIGGGDSIQNNVTIQAANTTQAASDILVSLTKIKRRRYS